MVRPAIKTPPSAFYVDMGTTNTRVWWAQGADIFARAQAAVGVRDTARSGSTAAIRAALRDLLDQMQADRAQAPSPHPPTGVVAAGMITSALGLVEIPHVAAPAGLADLAAAAQCHHFPDVTPLPVLLIPGVRVGPSTCDGDTIGLADVMRGEETLCMGLHALGRLPAGGTLLNLGSHWKAIGLDAQGRIAASVTSLAGELIHVAQTETILASSVPHERPQGIDRPWMESGMREERRSGLARALFCVRLLEQRSGATPAERLSFLVGAFIAADLDALQAKGALTVAAPVVIAGGGALGEAWQAALAQASIPARILSPEEAEIALLTGLQETAAAYGGSRGKREVSPNH